MDAEVYRLALEAIESEAIFVVDGDGRILTWNAGAERLFGLSAAEMVGECASITFTREDRDAGVPDAQLTEVLRHGRVSGHRWIEDQRGARRWARFEVAALRDAPGLLRGFIHVIRGEVDGGSGDATEMSDLKRTEVALQESQATIQAFFDASPALMGLVELTDDGDIRHLFDDRASCHFFGLPPGGMSGRSARELGAPEESIALWRDHYLLSQARAGPVPFEYPHESPSGIRWLSCTVAPVGPGPSGRQRFCYVAEDVTDRKHAEDQVAEAGRRKDEFLATLAHELRNPLAPLRTGLQLLQVSTGSESTPDVHAMMDRQLSHMIRLIDDLLDVSRINSGKISLRREMVTLQSVIEVAIEAVRPSASRAGHTLTLDMPAEPIWLHADRVRMAQVLSNLLANAVKYTPEGGFVTVLARRDGEWAEARVADTGLGIPREMTTEVFEMFAQVNRSLDRAQGGLGIGLALVRRLVELHGGTVCAESPGPGRGSTFTIRLPVALPALRADAPARGPGPPASVVRLRILVVDDNRDAADSLARLLVLSGHTTHVVYDGLEALAAAREFAPWVILLDLGLPGLDGHEVARRVREDRTFQGILIALTGWGGPDDQRRSREAGFDHHLIKPVDHDELNRLLARLADGMCKGTPPGS